MLIGKFLPIHKGKYVVYSERRWFRKVRSLLVFSSVENLQRASVEFAFPVDEVSAVADEDAFASSYQKEKFGLVLDIRRENGKIVYDVAELN